MRPTSFVVTSALFALILLAVASSAMPVEQQEASNVDDTSDANTNVLQSRSNKSCRAVADCRKVKIPSGASRRCKNKTCIFACNSGYKRVGQKCIYQKKKTVIKAATKAATVSKGNVLAASGVKAFTGTNTGAVLSWFRASSAEDSTNGHSWCLYPYSDNVPGFAVSLSRMIAAAGSTEAAGEMFCGLEAVITTPDGRSATLYITDAFDDAWVRTPTSADVLINAFSKLYGKTPSSKQQAISGATWRFTGKRNSQYKYRGVGSG